MEEGLWKLRRSLKGGNRLLLAGLAESCNCSEQGPRRTCLGIKAFYATDGTSCALPDILGVSFWTELYLFYFSVKSLPGQKGIFVPV